jgi:hypothetical protein
VMRGSIPPVGGESGRWLNNAPSQLTLLVLMRRIWVSPETITTGWRVSRRG